MRDVLVNDIYIYTCLIISYIRREDAVEYPWVISKPVRPDDESVSKCP